MQPDTKPEPYEAEDQDQNSSRFREHGGFFDIIGLALASSFATRVGVTVDGDVSNRVPIG